MNEEEMERRFNRINYLLTMQPLYELQMFQEIWIKKIFDQTLEKFSEALDQAAADVRNKKNEKKQREFIEMVNGIIKEGSP